jgi:hypothetical protein
VLIVAMQEQPALLGALVAKLRRGRLDQDLKPVDATLRFVKPEELRLDLVMRGRGRRWAIVDPKGPGKSVPQDRRVIRGGGWNDNDPTWVRAEYRVWDVVSNRHFNVGFRCVRAQK